MAISKIKLSILALISTLFLMPLNPVHSAPRPNSDILAFDFESFEPNEKDLILQGAAVVPTNTTSLILTKSVQHSVGRVLYYTPLRLWDSITNTVASFETSFNYLIKYKEQPADGLAFFLAPTDTKIPPGSAGGYLGLYPSNASLISDYKAIAVEFDTYTGNKWDPNYPHIGIDNSKIESVSITPWVTNRTGEVLTAEISYDSISKTLKGVSYHPKYRKETTFEVTHKIDLATHLPEWVSVGITASTGELVATHEILSWEFVSILTPEIRSKQAMNKKKKDMYISRYV